MVYSTLTPLMMMKWDQCGVGVWRTPQTCALEGTLRWNKGLDSADVTAIELPS